MNRYKVKEENRKKLELYLVKKEQTKQGALSNKKNHE